jgi:hypothetical protein
VISREDWDRVVPHIEAALAQGGSFHDLQEVVARMVSGEARLMVGQRSAGVIETWDYPRSGKKALHVWLAGGEMAELVGPMAADLERVARAEGCTDMLITGRRGWERALAPAGFKPAWQVLRKTL